MLKKRSLHFYDLLHLHFLVFIWGFTGILGKYISLDSYNLVLIRIIISVFSMFPAFYILHPGRIPPLKNILKYMLMGLVLLLHWITFYASIKVSNVSIALCAFSSTSLFASIFGPIIFKRKLDFSEILISIAIVFAFVFTFQTEWNYRWGIFLGIAAAATSACFTTYNGWWSSRGENSFYISFFQLSGALFFCIAVLPFIENVKSLSEISINDYKYLILLGSVCTVYPFIACVSLMKRISPFTVSFSVNLEPVYSILMALYFFPKTEKMTTHFYIGFTTIIFLVFFYQYWKYINSRKIIS